jgi:glycosyltransferase involved in cell wall biosynthesis
MRIGFDATSLCRKITGIETYTLNLAKALLESDADNEYVLFFRRQIHPELEAFRGRAEMLLGPASQIVCEQVWLPGMRRRRKLDLVHYPAFPPGWRTRGPFVMTVFDGTLWRNPDWLSWKARRYMAPLTLRAARGAAKVLTISEFSRSEILKFTGAAPENVVNAGIAISPAFGPVDDERRRGEVRVKYGLPPEYVLSVGSFEPRKNLGVLLEAWARLCREVPGWSRNLVLAGRRAWGAEEIEARIGSLGLKFGVVIADYIAAGDLPAVYAMAEVFVFPSLYEGFGLPPLEAMACGTPVVCSRAPALPEAVGEAAELFDPGDVPALAAALRRVAGNRPLREKLREAGLARAAAFSWTSVARRVQGLYNGLGTRQKE